MADSLPNNYTIDPIKWLDFLCSERNLEVRFHNCTFLSTVPFKCSACVTVDGTTLEGRGWTTEAAKQDAANRMIALLKKKIVNDYKSGEKPKKANWDSPKIKHPCDRLQIFCGRMKVPFKFSDCRSVSVIPPMYTATATVLNVTVTAEGPTKQEAKKNAAAELLLELGWDKKDSEETVKSSQSIAQEKKHLSFTFDEPIQHWIDPSRFNACVTVNDVTIAPKEKSWKAQSSAPKENTYWKAQSSPACDKTQHFNGKPVKFGYHTRTGYTIMSKDFSEKDKTHPVCQLICLCKQREIEFEFKPKEATPPHTCAASATILGVTVEAEGKSVHDVHCKIAIKMLAKLGWDTADIEEMSIDSTLKPDVSHKKEDQLNSSVTTEVSEDNAVTRNSLLSPAQQQLQNLCSTRNLTFKFHDCQLSPSDPPNWIAFLTVNGIKTVGSGETVEAAKDQATHTMIYFLEMPFDFGYETKNDYTNTS